MIEVELYKVYVVQDCCVIGEQCDCLLVIGQCSIQIEVECCGCVVQVVECYFVFYCGCKVFEFGKIGLGFIVFVCVCIDVI